MATPLISALEIGTTTIKVVMGEIRDDGVVMAAGIGECESRGVRKGEIIEFELALESIRKALELAESDSGRSIGDKIYLAASGGRVESRLHRAGIPILNEYDEPGGEISEADVEHTLEVARKIPLSDDRIRLHTLQQHFEVDGRGGIVNPVGMLAEDLKVGMMLIHGRRSTVENLKRLIQNVPIICADAAFSGFCSALAVLTTEQKRDGSVVIDMGGGTTDYVVYKGGLICLAGSIAVGGDHITSDISSGLNITRVQSEKLKKEHGSAVLNRMESEQNISIPADVGFSGRIVRSSTINTIINARVEETFQLIADQIDARELSGVLSAGVLLTGGGSALDGAVDLARQVFNAPAQIGCVNESVGISKGEGSRFAPVIGCAHYAVSQMEEIPKDPSVFKKVFGKLWGGQS